MLNFIFRILWQLISFAENIYWFVWRRGQLQRFCSVGDNVSIGRYCYFTNATISIGKNVSIGQYCRFQSTLSRIKIGNHVMVGPNVSIHGGNHRFDVVGKYMKEILLTEKLPENDRDIIIEDDVWIGSGAIILAGVTIGEGSVIGAGSVVTKNVPPYTVLVGSKMQKSWPRWDLKTIQSHKELLNSRNSLENA